VLDDGLDGWRDGFAPVATRRWWLVPTWGDAPTSVPGDGRPVLHLDPGRTFGSGSHPTTRLCVDAVADAVESATSSRAATTIRVLDVGAGSGVLAIAGVLAGAAEATAIDIDPASPAVVVANAATNGIGDRIAASEEPLAAVVAAGHRFEVVAANLLAPVVRDLATDLVAALAPAGTLIVSGLLADRWGDAVGGLVAAGAEVVEVIETDGWVAVVLRGPSGSAAS
jgi:ribosomal protein L11 methyltransferase